MKYTIYVTEVRELTMEIEAESREEALDKADAEYWGNLLKYDAMLEPYDTVISDKRPSLDLDRFK